MIYVLNTLEPPEDLATKIAGAYPDNYYELTTDSTLWMIYAPGKTARQVAESLGYILKSQGSYVITGVSGYWGNYSRDLWDWVAQRKAV